MTVPSFPGPVEPISESIEVEKKKAMPRKATGSTPHAPGEGREDQYLSKVVKGAPWNRPFPDLDGFFRGINEGPTGAARPSTEKRFVSPSPSKWREKPKRTHRWWQGFGGRFGFKHGRSLFIIWEVAQTL